MPRDIVQRFLQDTVDMYSRGPIYRESLTPVRAFYLDLAQWAIEDPARWGPWVAPCPVREDEVNLRKAKRPLRTLLAERPASCSIRPPFKR